MGRFRNTATDVVVSVADAKDARFAGPDWAPAEADKPSPPPSLPTSAAAGRPDRKHRR